MGESSVKNRKNLVNRNNFFEIWGVPIALAVLCLVMTLTTKSFATLDNILNILRNISILAIAGIGSTLIFISGGMDISISSVMALGGVSVMAMITRGGIPTVPAILIAVVLGCLVGVVNGSLVTFVKLPPFIATLGTMQAVRGCCYIYTGGYSIYGEGLSAGFKMLGRGYVGPIPVPVIVMFILYAAFIFLLRKTTFGTQIYAVGSNENASALFGIAVKKVRILVYMIGGMTAAMAGVILASRLQSAQGALADGMEFDVMTAVVLGGTSIYGGKGKLGRTLLGALVIGVINNGMTLMNVSTFYPMVVSGVVLVLALALDRLSVK